MIHLLFLSLIITIFEVSSSSLSNEVFSPYQKNLDTFTLTPNASADSDQVSPVFSDRTHRPNKNNSLESSPTQNLLSPLLPKRRHASLNDDNFNQEGLSIKIPHEDLYLNSSTDNDNKTTSKDLSSKIKNICPETICGYERNKVIIASLSLTVFTSGILCLLLIKD